MKRIIATPSAPAAIGPYSQGVVAGGALYISGQLPINPATGEMPDSIEEQTAQSLANLAAIVEEAGGALSDVVKTTVLLAEMSDFGAMNGVYSTFFDHHPPARACYQVAALPKSALVEIEALAVING